LQRQTETQLRVCANGNRNKRCGFRKCRQINRPRQNARSRNGLTQSTFRTVVMRSRRTFRRFRPRILCGFLIVVMTRPVRMSMRRTGGGDAAGIFHQRVQPGCTRRKNQLPARQHQSEKLLRAPTHRVTVQVSRKNSHGLRINVSYANGAYVAIKAECEMNPEFHSPNHLFA
jgi:hypothetical protein